MSWQDKMYKLGGNLFGIDEIAKIASQYPEDVNTNPIGSYGVGVQSDAKHRAASARASDMFYDMLGYTPLRGLPESFKEPMADTMSLVGGGAVELGGSLFDWAKSGFKDNNYLTAAKEDIISDYKGSFGTPYGTSISDVMDNVYKENNYTTKYDNIFNQGTIDTTQATPKQVNDVLAMDSQLSQSQAGNRQVPTTVVPDPVKQTVINTPSNQTKFGANRSTAIKGGRGARGNYSKPAAKSPSPVFKSYGPPNMQRFR
jgi:hypothetical protein